MGSTVTDLSAGAREIATAMERSAHAYQDSLERSTETAVAAEALGPQLLPRHVGGLERGDPVALVEGFR